MEILFNSWLSALCGSGIVGFLVKILFDRYFKWLEKIESRFASISDSQMDIFNGLKIIELHISNLKKLTAALESKMEKLNDHEVVLKEHAVKIAFLESDFEHSQIVN